MNNNKKQKKTIPTVSQSKPKAKCFNKDRVYEIAKNNQELRDTLIAYSNFELEDDYTLLQAILPSSKRTILNELVESYDKYTNIPLLIPVQQFLSYLAGYLIKREAVILKDTKTKIPTDIWVTLLASSGSAKSWSEKRIAEHFKNYLDFEPNISDGCESTAAYYSELKRVGGRGMMSRDEWGQHFKDIVHNQGPLIGSKGFFLKMYDRAKLSRTLKKEADCIEIDNVCVSLYTQNVQDTFYSMMDLETFLDGFAQRSLYTIIEDRKDRDPIDWIDLPEAKLIANWGTYFEEIKNLIIHNEYTLIENALPIIQTHFKGMFSRPNSIPASFIKRLYIATYKYALLYHILLCKETELIDEEDINCACKYMLVHMYGIQKLKENTNFADIEEDERILKKVMAKLSSSGKPLTINAIVRDLITNHKTRFREANKTKNFVSVFFNE